MSRRSFAYSPAQAQSTAGSPLLGRYGAAVLPIVVWAALVLAYTRDRAVSWARRLLG